MDDRIQEKLESTDTVNSDNDNESQSELQELFTFAPSKDWSEASDVEVETACAEAKLWLGM